MKKSLILFSFLLSCFICNGQLKPPKQVDTLNIQSVTYNYSEILEENWPCKYILKSATHFQFGDQKFKIEEVETTRNIIFHLISNNSARSQLVYSEYGKEIRINYSGYTFACVLSRYKQHQTTECKLAKEAICAGKVEDIETPEPLHQSSVDKRKLFGSGKESNTYGAPNAKLSGRTVIGTLPLPSHNIRESGKVVVKIKVNRDGTVVEAQPGEAGTTLTNKSAWEAAKKAATRVQFNTKADAPEFQYGTITYIFNITN